MKNFSFYHLTDTHFYANSAIGSWGESYKKWCDSDQRCIDQSEAILDAALKAICEDDTTDIVLISGDLTCDGEKESHDVLREKLRKLKNHGKKVYVTFATHDFYMHARKFADNEIIDLQKYNRAELRRHYDEFGFSEAIAEHAASYSYCVQLTDDTRLLCLNDDGDFDLFCGYYNDLLSWIKEQVENAKAANCRIFAMTHHPILPPSPIYPLVSHKAMLGGYEFTGPYMADLGIEYLFVGHTHIHDINFLTTKNMNTLYQINTAALSAYPLSYRKIEYSDKGMDVKTVTVENIDYDLGGENVVEFSKKQFIRMIRDVIDALENDESKFVAMISNIAGCEEASLQKIKPVVKILGKKIAGMTLSDVGKLLLISQSIEEEVKDLRVLDFLCDSVINMYGGHQNCTPDSALYKSVVAICDRLGKVIKIKDYHGEPVNLTRLVTDTIYDSGYDDHNAFLPCKI